MIRDWFIAIIQGLACLKGIERYCSIAAGAIWIDRPELSWLGTYIFIFGAVFGLLGAIADKFNQRFFHRMIERLRAPHPNGL
jgi:hypothetical protein